jgi:hypothetical protein
VTAEEAPLGRTISAKRQTPDPPDARRASNTARSAGPTPWGGACRTSSRPPQEQTVRASVSDERAEHAAQSCHDAGEDTRGD